MPNASDEVVEEALRSTMTSPIASAIWARQWGDEVLVMESFIKSRVLPVRDTLHTRSPWSSDFLMVMVHSQSNPFILPVPSSPKSLHPANPFIPRLFHFHPGMHVSNYLPLSTIVNSMHRFFCEQARKSFTICHNIDICGIHELHPHQVGSSGSSIYLSRLVSYS